MLDKKNWDLNLGRVTISFFDAITAQCSTRPPFSKHFPYPQNSTVYFGDCVCVRSTNTHSDRKRLISNAMNAWSQHSTGKQLCDARGSNGIVNNSVG